MLDPGQNGPDGVPDALAALTVDDAVPTSDASAPSSEAPPTPPTEAPPPDQTTETLAPVTPAVAGLDADPANPIPTFAAPTGEPLVLQVDRNAVPIEGAVTTPDGGRYFAPGVWERFQSRFVGDRSQWQQERRHLQSEAFQAQQQGATVLREKETKLNAGLAALSEIFGDQSGERFQAAYQNWGQAGPLLMAKAEQAAVIAERDALAAEKREREEAVQLQEVTEQTQRSLGATLAQTLDSPEYKGLMSQEEAVGFLKEIWETGLNRVCWEDQRGVHVDPEAMRQVVEQRANLIRRYQKGQATVAEKKATNAAVLAPTKPGIAAPAKATPPKVEKPRDKDGKFARQSEDDWEKEFNSTQYHKQLT